MEKIYILGNGSMAKAIAYGIKDKFEVVIVSRKPFLSEFQNELYENFYNIEGKNIILAFKPYALQEVTTKLEGEARNCISVLARTGLADLCKALRSQNHAISLPNLAAKHKASLTPFVAKGRQSDEIYEILSSFGEAIEFYDEATFNAASVVSGCAPAYLALVADALSSGAVLNGVSAKSANKLVAGLFESFAKLLKHDNPHQIKEQICSPGGTTIEGVYELEKAGIRGSFMKALQASYQKQGGVR